MCRVEGNRGSCSHSVEAKGQTDNRISSLPSEKDVPKNHPKRDRIVALLRSALTLSVLAIGILAVVALAAQPILCGAALLGVTAGYMALSAYNAHRIGELKGRSLTVGTDFLFLLLGGPIFPIFEAFGKVKA